MQQSQPRSCIKTYSKCGKILSICSQDIEGKQNLLDFMTRTTLIQYSPPISKRGYKTGNNPNLNLFNIYAHTKYGQILSILKILSGNEILTSVKGHNSTTNVQKMMCNNHKLDLVCINAYSKCGKIQSICSY